MNLFNTIKIGDQIWRKKNLAIDDGGEGIKIIDGDFYYTYDAAQRIVKDMKDWRIPTREDFVNLIKHFELQENEDCDLRNWSGWINPENIVKKLKIKFLGGYRDTGTTYTLSGIPCSGYLYFFDERAYFWTSTKFETKFDNYADYIMFCKNSVEICHKNKSEYLPIRLIKNEY